MDQFPSSRELGISSHSRRLEIAAPHKPFTLWSAPAPPGAECARLILCDARLFSCKLICPLRLFCGVDLFAPRFQKSSPVPPSTHKRCASSKDRVLRSARRASLRLAGISGSDLEPDASSFPWVPPHRRRFSCAQCSFARGGETSCTGLGNRLRKRTSGIGFRINRRGTTSISTP
jgi:hypothetical protein